MALGGSCGLGFQIGRHVFSDLLDRTGSVQLSRDLYTAQLGRVGASLYCIRLIDV